MNITITWSSNDDKYIQTILQSLNNVTYKSAQEAVLKELNDSNIDGYLDKASVIITVGDEEDAFRKTRYDVFLSLSESFIDAKRDVRKIFKLNGQTPEDIGEDMFYWLS